MFPLNPAAQGRRGNNTLLYHVGAPPPQLCACPSGSCPCSRTHARHTTYMTVQAMATGRTDMDRAGKRAGMKLRRGDAALHRVAKLVLWFKKTSESYLFLVTSRKVDRKICWGEKSQDRGRRGRERAANKGCDR